MLTSGLSALIKGSKEVTFVSKTWLNLNAGLTKII